MPANFAGTRPLLQWTAFPSTRDQYATVWDTRLESQSAERKPEPVPIITVSNQKGGVGKTTSTLNLGAALQEMGKRVLLIDLDPQGSLTAACGILDVDAVPTSIGELMIARAQKDPSDVMSAIMRGPCGLDLVPGNAMLSAAELI